MWGEPQTAGWGDSEDEDDGGGGPATADPWMLLGTTAEDEGLGRAGPTPWRTGGNGGATVAGRQIERSLAVITEQAPHSSTTILEGRNLRTSFPQFGMESPIPATVDSLLQRESIVSLTCDDDLNQRVTESLYEDFMTAVQSNPSSHELFDLVHEFEQLCWNLVTYLNSLLAKIPSHHSKHTSLVEVKTGIQEELKIWRLIRSYYQDAISYTEDSLATDVIPALEDTGTRPSGAPPTEKEVTKMLYQQDPITRQWQILVDWLERSARDLSGPEDRERVEYFQDRSIAWENTLLNLQVKKRQKGIMARDTGRPMVTSVDPDAPLRQSLPLHDLDMRDEDRLLRHVFLLVRHGQLEEAQQVCVRVGQMWRAAAMEGWRPYHDPNLNSEDAESADTLLPVEGNPHRELWKMMAWKASSDPRLPMYERATLGTLCGNLSAALLPCTTWEDMLWAHFRVMVDLRVEEALRMNPPREYVCDMPAKYYSQHMNPGRVFREVEASEAPQVQLQLRQPYTTIAKLLILREEPNLALKLAAWSAEDGHTPQQSRFFAHLNLFLQHCGADLPTSACDQTVEAYVHNLVEMGNAQLVAFYSAYLPLEAHVRMYVKFLSGVTVAEEMREALRLAQVACLEIDRITKTLVTAIRTSGPSEGDTRPETTSADLAKVAALDWLTFVPQHRGECLCQANALMRQFVCMGKVEAAKSAFAKVPLDSIDLVLRQHAGNERMPPRLSNAVKEFLCFQAYLDAQESFSDWFEHFHKRRPKSIPSGADTRSLTLVEHITFEHKERSVAMEMDKWVKASGVHSQAATDRLYNVLLFPEGGWLVDKEQVEDDADMDNDDDEDVEERRAAKKEEALRAKQMEGLRKLCIPQCIFLLLSLLQQTGQYHGCLQLNDILMSRGYALQSVFSEDQLQEVAGKLSSALVELADREPDPWALE